MSDAPRLAPEIAAAQRRASDPDISVWVSANAGAGKTHVLTERVLRLLLAGAAPEQILCLTYTKAAAAEMRGRIAQRLGAWTLADDEDLLAQLAALEGRPPDEARRRRARTLFARALEAPGGLKIMTIHAFCESVLHRFAREAGVPFDFTVIEDAERALLVRRIRDDILAGPPPEHADAVATLFAQLSDAQIEAAIAGGFGNQRLLRQLVGAPAAAKHGLRKLLGVRGRPASAAVIAEIEAGYDFSAADHAALFAAQPPKRGGKTFTDFLSAVDPAAAAWRALFRAFLTGEGSARKNLLNKALATALPELAARLKDEAQRLEDLAMRLKAATLIERSEALLDVCVAISARYEADKRARSRLDFDDLVAALTRLLTSSGQGEWVRYKLDSGLTHILVDEGQDTNAEQWAAIDALVDDFFDGASAADRRRTIFAVGDEKQSIYSFQGADPSLLGDKANEYALKAASARLDFLKVDLRASFRTLPEVLRAVDLTFADPELRAAVLAGAPVEHVSARAAAGGRVELWPPAVEPVGEAGTWPLDVPFSLKGADRQIAERIADTITAWIEAGRALPARGRAVTANDVLILVQKRGPLFHEIIRALTRAGLPTPGADRLGVTRHIVATDLLALGDVALNPHEDLQLAALLRSPLFDLDEDDLFGLAAPRGADQSLWEALAASPKPAAGAALARLEAWRVRIQTERPFEFYAHVLHAEDGLKRFHARLGAEVDDIVAAFLDMALEHERSPQPSLAGFLAARRADDIEIKRELGEAGGGVRVMSVHGAKGLEAPIVILADATATPKSVPGPLYLRGGAAPLLVHAGSKEAHTPATLPLRDAELAGEAAEYWRKLYVAMTRAADELYLTGSLTKIGGGERSWYGAVRSMLAAEGDGAADGGLVFPRGAADGDLEAIIAPAAALPVAVDLAPLPPPRLVRMIRPGGGGPEGAFENAAEALAPPRDPDLARREGVALHALLHHLAGLAPSLWPIVAPKALATLLPEAPSRHAPLAEKAAAILGRAEFTEIFGLQSRGEVPLLIHAEEHGRPALIAGRVDRLVVTPDRVLIVDFKSDARPPADVLAVAPAYRRQLALYALCATQLFKPRRIEAAILWTSLETLMKFPKSNLDPEVEAFTIR